MSTTDTDDDIAAARVRTLAAHFRQHPVTSAAGHSYTPAGTRTPATVSPALVDLSMVDHLSACVREMVGHARQANPDAGPAPDRIDDTYAWYIANTANSDEAVRQRRDTVIYRQSLEHAIAAGNTKVVPPHRCPACRCFGLMWERNQRTVVCTNKRCRSKDGLSQTWSLAQLAYEHVAERYEKSVRDCAT
jgi:hypothetical protein